MKLFSRQTLGRRKIRGFVFGEPNRDAGRKCSHSCFDFRINFQIDAHHLATMEALKFAGDRRHDDLRFSVFGHLIRSLSGLAIDKVAARAVPVIRGQGLRALALEQGAAA